MICCGSFALAALLATGGTPRDTVAPMALSVRVQEEMASRWHVDTAVVRLQWGLLPVLAPKDIEGPMRLVGGGSDGWFVAVLEPVGAPPHAIRVRAGQLRRALVAAHPLRIGQILKADDITEQEVVAWSPPGTAAPAVIAGWEARRDLPAGSVFGAGTVLPPRVIGTGDKVVFAWEKNGVRVEREAVALGPARLGEAVSGRVGSGRIVGKATGPGAAELTEVMQ